MRRSKLLVLSSPVLVVVLAGCGSEEVSPREGSPRVVTAYETPAATPTARTEYTYAEAPRVRLYLPDGDVDLGAWTSCYGNMCADGIPPENPEDVGSPESIEFGFEDPGWKFHASYTQVGVECPRRIEVEPQRLGEHLFRLLPPGEPGTWDVTLNGTGQGDTNLTFRWHTTGAGVFPESVTSLVYVRPDKTSRDYYPDIVQSTWLRLTDLADNTASASAKVTVTAADGAEATVDLGAPDGTAKQRCASPGDLSWSVPDDAGAAARALPGTAFTYRVDLELDGKHYRGSAAWPQDVAENGDGSVPLTWEPALPVYRG